MNKTDMELQAIREKLRSLTAEPQPSQALPWSSSRLAHSETAGSFNQPLMATENALPAATLAALKRRSSQGVMPNNSCRAASATPAEQLVAQAMAQLEAQIDPINQLSQQQAAALNALKVSAARVEADLLNQGLQAHPMALAIAHFHRACESAVIPQVRYDQAGQFELVYRTTAFYQAAQDALRNAQALRDRRAGGHHPFNDPLTPEASGQSFGQSTSSRWRLALFQARQIWDKRLRRLRRRPNRPTGRPQAVGRLKPAAFSWLDGTIWFSGAVIVRLVANLFLQAYPILWMPLIVLVLALIAIALYRTLLSPYPNAGHSYRLLIAIAGVLVGGQL